MWLLSDAQVFTPLTTSALPLGRGQHGLPTDVAISRLHCTLAIESTSDESDDQLQGPTRRAVRITQVRGKGDRRMNTLEHWSSRPPLPPLISCLLACLPPLSQLGRHPIVLFRLEDLARLGLLATGVIPVSRSHLAARSSRGEWLEAGKSSLLHAGDAFGVSTSVGVTPFWIAATDRPMRPSRDTRGGARSQNEAAPGTPVLASLSLTPPGSHTSSPLRHVSCGSLGSPARSASLVGPTSHFYQSARASSVERALDQAVALDAGTTGGVAVLPGVEDPLDMRARLDAQQALEAERRDLAQQAREQEMWNLNYYPESKRRKIVHASAERDNQLQDQSNEAQTGDQRATTPTTLPSPTPSPVPASAISPATAVTSDVSSAAAAATPAPAAAGAAATTAPSPAAAASSPPSFVPPTLVMPPLSVLDFRFSCEKANPIALAALRDLFEKHPASRHPDLRITIVVPGKKDVPADGAPREVYEYFRQREVDERFDVRVGDITDLASIGVNASYLVHPTTWRFVGGEGGRIARFMDASYSERLVAKYPEGAKIGWVYVTSVPRDCELASRCPGVSALFTCRSPNMNDARPDSLQGNYLRGCRELTTTYSALFLALAAKIAPPADASATSAPTPANEIEQTPPASGSNTHSAAATPAVEPTSFARTPSPSTPPAPPASSPPFSAHLPTAPAAAAAAFVPPASCPRYQKPAGMPPTPGHFSVALFAYVKQPRPAALEPYVYWEDAEFVAIYDVYPKARVHLLLLPKKNQIDSVHRLQHADLPLLAAMESRARWLCDSLRLVDSAGRTIPLRCGFHAVPSLRLLHLHIISQEFESESLRNKKHWNSFCTGFFVSPQRVRDMIASSGGPEGAAASARAADASFFTSAAANARERERATRGTLESQMRACEPLLKQELRCHRLACALRCQNIPELKRHLQLCASPYPINT